MTCHTLGDQMIGTSLAGPNTRLLYTRLNDAEAAKRAQSGDKRATEFLLYKYRRLVKTKTRSYYLVGAENDDLVQIGMIGLWQAIMDYSSNKDLSFVSFARICIERHIITAIKAATRLKQSPLNNAISLDYTSEEDNKDFDLMELLISDVEIDPEEIVIKKERRNDIQRVFKYLLSKFEWEVLKRYQYGKSYSEIARDLACNLKSVDNALGRIKRKIALYPRIYKS